MESGFYWMGRSIDCSAAPQLCLGLYYLGFGDIVLYHHTISASQAHIYDNLFTFFIVICWAIRHQYVGCVCPCAYYKEVILGSALFTTPSALGICHQRDSFQGIVLCR